MITRDGMNSLKETHMTLHVPEENCNPGLEVKIIIGASGITIGGEIIKWNELEVAKLRARGCEI